MFLVGLTGGIATGKSFVADILREADIPIIDADKIARDIVQIGEPAYNKIRDAFGPDVFKENGQLDRQKLGKLIFENLPNRLLLNKITHPFIYGEMRKQVFLYFLAGHQFVVMDLPLLYETKSVLDYLHKTIVVTCEADIQLQRLMERNSESNPITKRESLARINSQLPLEEKVTYADFVIESSGCKSNTRSQTLDIIKVLKASNTHIWNRFFLVFGIFAILVLLYAIHYYFIQ